LSKKKIDTNPIGAPRHAIVFREFDVSGIARSIESNGKILTK
jgi:hypothetical protein